MATAPFSSPGPTDSDHTIDEAFIHEPLDTINIVNEVMAMVDDDSSEETPALSHYDNREILKEINILHRRHVPLASSDATGA